MARQDDPGRARLAALAQGAGGGPGAWAGVASGLIWIGQAAAVAVAVGELAADTARVPWVWIGLFVLLGLARAGLDLLAQAWLVRAADRAVSALRRDLVAREAVRSPRDPMRPAAGALAALLAEKAGLVGAYLVRYRPAMLRVRILPLVLLAVAFPLSWAVAVILLVSGPLIPVFMALVGLAAREASERQMAEVGSLNAMLLERLRALTDIRLLAAPDRVVAGFARQAEDLRVRTMAVLRIAFLSSAVLELFSAIGVALVAVYVGFTLLGAITFGAWGGLGIAEGVFLILLAPAFFEPLRDLAAAWHDKAGAEAVATELAALEAGRGPRIAGDGGAAPRLEGPATVAFRGVAADAGGRRIAFPDFDLPAGGTLALSGASGAGKSTALALIAGLETPAEGAIRVAGQPLGPATADGWRARIGWLPQAPHFLAASLRRNLAPGPVPAAEMAEALRLAQAGGVVVRLPRGLDARLGESGAGVSGGEARRLLLARAALGRPDLILADEPTADLDDETAEAVVEGLLALVAGGAGLIVATHDARLAARMDQRIVIGGAG